MGKKFGFNPVVLTGIAPQPTPTDEVVVGGGTGEGASDAVVCNFKSWLDSAWAADLNNDTDIDELDYAAWWAGNNFSREDWEELNPDLPWEDYFE